MLKIIVLAYYSFLVSYVNGGFFELADIDDSLALLWNSRPTFPDKKLTECKVDTSSGVKYGVCTSPSHCLFTGGAPNGFCGILSTCCTYEKTCGKTSDAKISYFEGTDSLRSTTTPNCKYTIRLKNQNICQVRLDFVKFQLAPATPTPQSSTGASANLPTTTTTSIYKCADDRLVISPNYYGIPELCGNNDRQHVYIHINQSEGIMHSINLDVILADRSQKSYLNSPAWKIKITQLECPGKKNFLELPKQQEEETVQDFPMLAPLGAIQYFTEKHGYIKSFGFDGTASNQSYTYDQYYAMAFKRYPATCGVRFVTEWFNLPSTESLQTDDACYHYLFIPELHFDTTSSFQSKVCLNTLAVAQSFRAYPPGPIYIHFSSVKTDLGVDSDTTQKQGFNIKYELLSHCQ